MNACKMAGCKGGWYKNRVKNTSLLLAGITVLM